MNPDRFPYGKAPFWLTALALVSTLLVVATRLKAQSERADLTFALFAPNHLPLYKRIVPAFEREHGVRVSLDLVHQRALQTRLQNAMLAGTEVPDLVELPEDGLPFFTRGPLSDVGFLDLTERLSREGYRSHLVESRLSIWSSRGHVFALPHDVHPVMLMYRADLVEKLGIDVETLRTWDDFVAAGHKVTVDLDGDGIIDRFMIDLPTSGAFGLTTLLRQRGIGLFDEQGKVVFNVPETVDTMIWYLRQTHGPQRIAYECGWGQSLMKAMIDGLALFYIGPDWRTMVTQMDVPSLAGKMKVMPLPAWTPGGRRTSVWGGTGLAITKAGRDPELAWQFAKSLYFTRDALGERFLATNIIPPFKDAWSLPEFSKPNAYFSNQPLGALYAALAPDTPPVWSNAYSSVADSKLNEAFLRAAAQYDAHGEAGLRPVIEKELASAQAYVERVMARNVLARR